MGNETKWPAGPWEYSGGGIWAKSPWNARVRILDVGTFSPMNGVDSTAIGHVAAASPKLYEALERMVERFGVLLDFYEEGTGDFYQPLHDEVAAARAALASARGEG
jgi:hypothetical protein